MKPPYHPAPVFCIFRHAFDLSHFARMVVAALSGGPVVRACQLGRHTISGPLDVSGPLRMH